MFNPDKKRNLTFSSLLNPTLRLLWKPVTRLHRASACALSMRTAPQTGAEMKFVRVELPYAAVPQSAHAQCKWQKAFQPIFHHLILCYVVTDPVSMATDPPLEVYLDLLSQPCRAVHILLTCTRIPHRVRTVALRKGQHSFAKQPVSLPTASTFDPSLGLKVQRKTGHARTHS